MLSERCRPPQSWPPTLRKREPTWGSGSLSHNSQGEGPDPGAGPLKEDCVTYILIPKPSPRTLKHTYTLTPDGAKDGRKLELPRPGRPTGRTSC